MTRAEQIDAALEIIAPPTDKRAEDRHDIEVMLDYVKRSGETARERKAFGSKEGKKALKRFVKTLQRLRIDHSKFPPAAKPWFAEWFAKVPPLIDSELAKAETWAAEPSGKAKRDAFNAKAAVEAAYHLLLWWSHKPTGTRGKKWEELAKVLTGDRRTNVFDHIQSFDRKQPMFRKRTVDNGIVISRISRKPDLI